MRSSARPSAAAEARRVRPRRASARRPGFRRARGLHAPELQDSALARPRLDGSPMVVLVFVGRVVACAGRGFEERYGMSYTTFALVGVVVHGAASGGARRLPVVRSEGAAPGDARAAARLARPVRALVALSGAGDVLGVVRRRRRARGGLFEVRRALDGRDSASLRRGRRALRRHDVRSRSRVRGRRARVEGGRARVVGLRNAVRARGRRLLPVPTSFRRGSSPCRGSFPRRTCSPWSARPSSDGARGARLSRCSFSRLPLSAAAVCGVLVLRWGLSHARRLGTLGEY